VKNRFIAALLAAGIFVTGAPRDWSPATACASLASFSNDG
jgi:hypothetical protein